MIINLGFKKYIITKKENNTNLYVLDKNDITSDKSISKIRIVALKPKANVTKINLKKLSKI